MPFSNGTQVNDQGQMQTLSVAQAYVPVASDVFINGVLHDVNGVMYVSNEVPSITRQFINGILHTKDGVRYISSGPAVNDWPEGFRTDALGAMIVTDAFTPPITFSRGIALSVGSVFVSDSGSGSIFDNRLLDDLNLDEYLLDDTNTDDVYLLDGAPFIAYQNAAAYSVSQDFTGGNNVIFRYDQRWKPDGTRMWFRNGGTSHPSLDNLYQYDVSPAWSQNPANWTLNGSIQIGNDNDIRTMAWVNSGNRIVFLNRWFSSFRRMDSYPASTPYDITTLGGADGSFTGLIGSEFGMFWSADWKKVLISRSAGEWNRYTTPIAGDLNSLVGPDQTWLGVGDSIALTPDELKLYVISGNNLASYDLAAPFSISPAPSNLSTGPSMNLPTTGGVWRGLNLRPDTGELLAEGDQNTYRNRSWTA